MAGTRQKLGSGRTERAELDPELVCTYRVLKKRYYRLKSWILTGRRYSTSLDPFRTYYVDPRDIREAITDHSVHEYDGMTAEVIPGAWDEHTVPFDELDVYRSLRERFEDGVDWEETELYQRVCREIRSGTVKWGCETIEEFDDRCEYLDSLYDSIRTEGYVGQDEQWKRYCESNGSERAGGPPANYDVIVDVSRDGEFLFVDGRHRLAIAKILGVERIPVQVKARHSEWQQKRELANSREQIAADHPDLCTG